MEHNDHPFDNGKYHEFLEILSKMREEGYDLETLKYALGDALEFTRELVDLCNGDKRRAAMIMCVVEGLMATASSLNLSDSERIRHKSHGRALARLVVENERAKDKP